MLGTFTLYTIPNPPCPSFFESEKLSVAALMVPMSHCKDCTYVGSFTFLKKGAEQRCIAVIRKEIIQQVSYG